MEEGSPPAMFIGAMYVSGYLTFVKVLEIIGGLLVAIPKTRRLGMLILGPIVVNILAINVFMIKGGWMQPPVFLVVIFSAFLLWAERKSFCALVCSNKETSA